MNSVQLHGIEDEYEARAEQAQNKIERNRSSLGSGFGFILCGFPGAGKTTAAKEIQRHLSEDRNDNCSVVSLDELAEVESANRAEIETFFTAVVSSFNIESRKFCVFDSLYSLDEIVFLSKYFDYLGIIFIEANHAARHSRLIKDARKEDKNLDDFSHDSLQYRDKEASAMGLNVIEETDFYDRKVKNVGVEKSEFEKYIKYVSQDLYLSYKHDEF